MSENRRLLDLVLPLGIIGCLMVILVPLPPAILDVLLAANITIAVIVLLTTIQIKTPMEFGIFPTLLLATVLGRVCPLYTSPSPRDLSTSRMPSSA